MSATFVCQVGMVEIYEATGLHVCPQCFAPYCRECGAHTEFAADVGDDWLVPGFVCACGWRVCWPAEGDPFPDESS